MTMSNPVWMTLLEHVGWTRRFQEVPSSLSHSVIQTEMLLGFECGTHFLEFISNLY